MKSVALIDADIVAFRVACTTEHDGQEIAEIRADELIRRICHDVNAVTYKCFLSGQDNFRYTIYPEYKANRKGKPKPKWLEALREHIVRYHGGRVINGHEADDELGIEQTAHGVDSIICSIDKDLLQIPGWHYNFVKQEQKFVSPFDGLRAFYGQVISGDGADNIPSYDGKVRNQVPQFIRRLIEPLNEMTEELDMYEHCGEVYSNQHEWAVYPNELLDRNAQCLYILKEEGKHWQPPQPGPMPD